MCVCVCVSLSVCSCVCVCVCANELHIYFAWANQALAVPSQLSVLPIGGAANSFMSVCAAHSAGKLAGGFALTHLLRWVMSRTWLTANIHTTSNPNGGGRGRTVSPKSRMGNTAISFLRQCKTAPPQLTPWRRELKRHGKKNHIAIILKDIAIAISFKH